MKGNKSYILNEISSFMDRLKTDHVAAYAAQASFFLILSAFPFTILILTCIRFLPITDADLIQLLHHILPGDIENFIVSIVSDLIRRSNNTILSFSIIITIWSASKGIMTISSGLNSVYRTNESRNYFVLRAIAMLHTLIVLAAMIILLVLFVFGNTIYNVIISKFAGLNNIATLVISIRVVFGFLILFVMFIILYRKLANHKVTIYMAAPGALFCAVSWITVSFAFSIYINYFSSYSKIYGSLAGLAIAMIWMYLMMNLLLWGGEINAILVEKYPERFLSEKEKK